ncbi:MAG TPA: hypothetical protein VGB98_24185 [Pyrinomonadaceae bacterium]
MKGSDTAGDVVAEMNRQGYQIEYCGLDLHEGFDILTDSLAERLTRPADLVFCHPPYADMIVYSGEVWGDRPHASDLSRCTSVEDFITKMQRGLLNVYDSLRAGGRYSVLIGDLRRAGDYHALQASLLAIAPGKLESVIIKQQHNCTSDRREYASRVIRIEHEYLLTWRRDGVVFGTFDATLATSERLRMYSNCTWRAIVEYAFEHFGNRATLEQLYAFIEEKAHSRIKSIHWKEKIRQTVGQIAVRLERGVYARGAGVQQQQLFAA